MARPQPIPRELICSECGLDWDDHPKNARKSDCIELLKDELEAKPAPATVPWVIHNRCCTHHCNYGHCNCYTYHGAWGTGWSSNDTYTFAPIQVSYTDNPAALAASN